MSESEKQFILRAALESEIRLDGRRNAEARDISVQLRTVDNSRSLARVHLGGADCGTQVACTVSCELSTPYPDRPNEGAFQISTDYMHSAGSAAAQGDALVEKSIQKCVDVESLCIVPGSKAWFVRCQLVVIDDCGSVADACSIAACAALLHFRRPDVTVVGEEVTVHSVREKIPVPLTIQYTPLCLTFAVLAGMLQGEHVTKTCKLVDSTEREEQVAVETAGMFQLVLNAHQEICGLLEGGAYLAASEVNQLVEQAAVIRTARGKILDAALTANPFEIV